MIKLIRQRLDILANPENGFIEAREQTFEKTVSDYLKLLLLAALLAGIVDFGYFAGRAAYVDIIYNADVDYTRMLNYGFSRSGGRAFFFLIAGTMLTVVLSMIIRPFIRMKLKDTVRIVIYSLSPLLVFGWLPGLALPMALWAAFIFVTSIRMSRKASDAKHAEYLRQRD